MSNPMKQLLLSAVVLIFGAMAMNKLIANEKQPQFAFQVISDGTENRLVVPRAITVIELIPLSGPTSKAPVSRGDFMLCRLFDWRDEEKVLHAGLKCGSDVYGIAKFNLEESK